MCARVRIRNFHRNTVYMTINNEQTSKAVRASATAVLLRDTAEQIQVLLVQKNHNINFGGSWVFPGGMVESEDIQFDDVNNIDSASHAVCRETYEEVSIKLNKNKLYAFSHWVTPAQIAKRYSTWFFLYNANHTEQAINIDSQEIIDAKWLTPQHALTLHAKNKLKLNGPSFVTLIGLSEFSSTNKAITYYQSRQPHKYLPRGFATKDGFLTLFQEDCAYYLKHEKALLAKGPMHRTLMSNSAPWRYICDALKN